MPPPGALPPTGFNPFDPIQDTETIFIPTIRSVNWRSFNPFDPIQDTETHTKPSNSNRCSNVSTHSIRYRILKHFSKAAWGPPTTVSTHSIRYRILKPTERGAKDCRVKVSTHSIRYRILKLHIAHATLVYVAPSMVSTHSIRYRILKLAQRPVEVEDDVAFQPIRSDTGY